MKCRAIIPLNRAGVEPYFRDRPIPSPCAWVDSGFRVESGPALDDNPFSWLTRAVYIPFDTMKTLTFAIDPFWSDISCVKANDPSPASHTTTLHFAEPPTRVKFTRCGTLPNGSCKSHFTFIQVSHARSERFLEHYN